MSTQSLVISNFKTGYETDREPFLINNDAFPILNNAYVWRGRILKKRGTTLLGRLKRTLTNQALGNTAAGVFTGNIISILTLNSASSIVPGSITVTIGAQIFTDNATTGNLSNGGSGAGTINYATGDLTITTNPLLGTVAVTITFSYYPNLPVMGLENFQTTSINFPILVGFDTKYSYQFNQSANSFYDVSFYKSSSAPVTWSGPNYQQFWSINYSNAMWVTNNQPGFHFKAITAVPTIGATTTITITNHGLTTNDYVFINEVGGVANLNNQSAKVSAVIDANNFQIVTTASTTGSYTSGGIAQYLTRSVSGDGIRWYDGDPTTSSNGWVNFSPPLDNSTTPDYLVGAKIIIPFKGRLLFFGVWRQKSSGGPTYYPNQMVYSQDGTPYYSVPVPVNQTSNFNAWYQNVAGFGGRLGAPINQEVVTVQENEDVLLTGYETKQLKLIFTGDDSFPFVYQTINSELGSQSTFSGINLDVGALTIGDYGLALTTQTNSQRIDSKIPDQIFDISSANNGSQRVTAVRDYRNEFIYFTYPQVNRQGIFPNTTLLYNYRDSTWATFDENYTSYGTYRPTTGYTWATLPFATWASWGTPWNFGNTGQRYPNIVGGNQHGFVLKREDSTQEDTSQYVSAISGTTITSPNHCLNDGEYVIISGCIGDAGITAINGLIYRISVPDNNINQFVLQPTSTQPTPTGNYLGGGVYVRLTNFNIKTKQFPIFWESARKTRIGTQRFLLDKTAGGQMTVYVYSGQNNAIPTNDPLISPYLIYSNIVFTSSESNNPFATNQEQIWHRLSNSFIGESIQIGFTLSDAQMRDATFNKAEIGIHAIAFDLYPGPILV